MVAVDYGRRLLRKSVMKTYSLVTAKYLTLETTPMIKMHQYVVASNKSFFKYLEKVATCC